MNLRDIYYKMRPKGIGRDRFEQLCKNLGLTVVRRRNKRKTTDSQGVKRFENLLKGLKVDRPCQIWQSDITYYEVRGRFYYLTFIQDAFTKVIEGYSVSKNLTTESTTLPALKKALRRQGSVKQMELILHSDGGGQYYSDDFLRLTRDNKIINSMGKEAQENGMAERLNGVIKNNYLKYYSIQSFEDLVKRVDQTVQLYNHEKPHKSLHRQTPYQFERQISQAKAVKADKRSLDSKDQLFSCQHPLQGWEGIGKKI